MWWKLGKSHVHALLLKSPTSEEVGLLAMYLEIFLVAAVVFGCVAGCLVIRRWCRVGVICPLVYASVLPASLPYIGSDLGVWRAHRCPVGDLGLH